MVINEVRVPTASPLYFLNPRAVHLYRDEADAGVHFSVCFVDLLLEKCYKNEESDKLPVKFAIFICVIIIS